jgi:dihydrofolate reductase
VGVCAFSGSFLGLGLVPAKWRCLIPPQRQYPAKYAGQAANRYALERKEISTMRKLVVGTFVTLDGVMQAPGGPDEDREDDFRHGGWLVPYFDEKFGAIMTEWTKRAGAFLLGRKTYEMFASSWPKSTDPADEAAAALNTRPKFVASRTLDKLAWNNSHLLKGDVAKEVAKLKAQEGDEIQVHGSGDLLQTWLIRCASGSFPSCSARVSASSAKARSRVASALSTPSSQRPVPSCMSTSAPANSGTAK